MSNTENKSKNKQKVKVVYKQYTSIFVFLKSILMGLALWIAGIYYSDLITVSIMILVSIIIQIQPFLLWNKKKLIILENKLYIYQNNNKILSWNYENDFNMINYEQDKFGKYFNYGDLILGDKENNYYIYKSINNPYETYIKLAKTIEKCLKNKDHNFKLISLINKKEIDLDKLDEEKLLDTLKNKEIKEINEIKEEPEDKNK